MTLLSDVISRVTESQYWARLSAAYDAAKPAVPWRSWSVRVPYLALSRFCTQALSEGRDIVSYLASGMYLDTGEGAALELFVKSQYQLIPTGPVFAQGRMLLEGVAGSSARTFAPGSVTVGTPGPFGPATRLYTNTEAGAIDAAGVLMMAFSAQVAGDAYNLPVDSPLELKSSFAGLTASNPASGPATIVGTGNAGLLFNAGEAAVTVDVQNLGTSQSLGVAAVFGVLVIRLATDGGGIATSTAEQVRRAVRDAINVGLSLVWDCRNAGDGTGLVAATLTPVPLEFAGTWLSQAGAPAQGGDVLKELAAYRWDTLGGGAGDGAPSTDAGTSDALIYWGRQKPSGYAASPVKRIRTYSNLDPDTGLASGGVIAVMIAGPAGALTAGDVAAVDALYYNPRKFSWGSRLATRSAANLNVAVSGIVNVKISSGMTLAGAQALVEAALTAYAQGDDVEPGFDIGQALYPETIAAHISMASRVGIRDVVLTAPAVPVSCTYAEIPVLDVAGLIYAYVP